MELLGSWALMPLSGNNSDNDGNNSDNKGNNNSDDPSTPDLEDDSNDVFQDVRGANEEREELSDADTSVPHPTTQQSDDEVSVTLLVELNLSVHL